MTPKRIESLARELHRVAVKAHNAHPTVFIKARNWGRITKAGKHAWRAVARHVAKMKGVR